MRRTLRGPLAGALLALGLLATACSGGNGEQHPSPSPTTVVPPAPTPSATGPAGSLKPALTGLLDRDGAPPAGYLGAALGGWVVNTTWAALQPEQNGPIAADNPIDRAIAEIKPLQKTYPGIGLKLRIRAGVDAPEWAKHLGGAPVSLIEPQGGATGTVGRFWTSAYGAAYDQLQRKLAAKYDGVPQVRETAVTRCTTFYSEPFLLGRSIRSNVTALLDAGFSTAADKTCLNQMIQAHTVWKHTLSDVAFNPYQDLEVRGRAGIDEAYTESMMTYCRAVLGQRCVLENNSLKSPVRYAQMYQAMARLGAPLSFQTASGPRVGNLKATLGYAESLGAGSVELPQSYRRAGLGAARALSAQLKQG